MEIFNDFFKVFNHLTVTQNTSHNFLSLLSWCFHIRGNAKSPQTLNLLLYIVDFSLNKHNYHSISRIFTYFKQDLIFVKGYEFSVKQKYCFYFKQKNVFQTFTGTLSITISNRSRHSYFAVFMRCPVCFGDKQRSLKQLVTAL